MTIEEEAMKAFEIADKESRKRGRKAIKQMFKTGTIPERDLENVAACRPNYRKSIRHLTIEDLIRMDIVRVI